MRLTIDLDEKYKNLYYEMAKATHSVIVEEDEEATAEIPEHVIAGVKRAQERVKNGHTKSYEEVKEILAKRWP